jgi:XTP/dITP diphosphohydrolase
VGLSQQKIIVATGNNGKLQEIREILHGIPCSLVSMREYWKAVIDIEENGLTFLENARIKADWVYKHSFNWALADDSGLEVDALGGAPGVRSARFAGVHGDTPANNRKLLSLLHDVPSAKRTARFVCSIVLRISDTAVIETNGICRGTIIDTSCGSGGFGYDPLFVPDGFDKTFAELTNDEKHRISHRGKALLMLKEKLNDFFAG